MSRQTGRQTGEPTDGRADRRADLASVVVDDEASVPAAEVLVGPHLALQLLQQRLIGPLPFGVHGGTDVVQDAHDPGRILGGSGKTLTSAAA